MLSCQYLHGIAIWCRLYRTFSGAASVATVVHHIMRTGVRIRILWRHSCEMHCIARRLFQVASRKSLFREELHGARCTLHNMRCMLVRADTMKSACTEVVRWQHWMPCNTCLPCMATCLTDLPTCMQQPAQHTRCGRNIRFVGFTRSIIFCNLIHSIYVWVSE